MNNEKNFTETVDAVSGVTKAIKDNLDKAHKVRMRKCVVGAMEQETNIPVLRLDTYVLDDNDEWVLEKEGSGWLSPFRGYSFQVSGTKTGVGDIGCTKVVGLGNITRAEIPYREGWQYRSNLGPNTTKTEILRWGAMAAVMNFCNHAGLIPPSFSDGISERDRPVVEFLKETIRWIDEDMYKYMVKEEN